MADIRVDRYEVNVSSNGQTQAITDVGDTSSAFVRILGCTKHMSAGPVGSTSNAEPNDTSGAVALTDTDELTFYKVNGTVKMMVEVWVYTGSPGGAYEFISRGRGSISSSGSSSTSAAVSGIVDTDACIPFHNGVISSKSSVNDYDTVAHYMYLNGSNQVVVGKNNTATSAGMIYYDVVEFTGSAWNVGHAKSSSHDDNGTHFTGGELVTMNTDSTGTGGTTFDVGDWATAMIIDGTMGGDSSETGLSDTMIYILPGTSTTTIRFTLDNTVSRNDSNAYAHILQADDMAVYHTTSTVSEGNNTYGTVTWPSGAPTSGGLETLALEWFPGTNGEGTAHLRGALHAQIRDNSGYEIQHWIHRSGNDVEAAYGVIDLSGLVAAVTDDLEADDITTGAPTCDDAAIGQTHVLAGDDISTQPGIDTAAIGQVHILASDEISTGTPSVDNSEIGQVHVLSGDDISTQPTIESPTLVSGAETDELSADDISTGAPSVASATIGQVHVLAGDDIRTTPTLDDSAIGLIINFAGNDISSTPTISDPTIGQIHKLYGDDITTLAPIVGQSTAGQSHILLADGISTRPTIASPFLWEGIPPREAVEYSVSLGTTQAFDAELTPEMAYSVTIADMIDGSVDIGTEYSADVEIGTEFTIAVQLY